MTNPRWFQNLSKSAQNAYLKAHPKSKINGGKSVKQHWTAKVDRDSKTLFKTLSLAEIRKRQTLAEKQITSAYESNNLRAIKDLQSMQNSLTRELLRRTK